MQAAGVAISCNRHPSTSFNRTEHRCGVLPSTEATSNMAISNIKVWDDMKFEVTITRMDEGVRTQIRADVGELNKDYSTWSDALIEAEHIGLINAAESMAAKLLPPGFPLHTKTEVESSTFRTLGFILGKTSPPE